MKDEELRNAYAARLAAREVDPARATCVSPEAMLAVVEDRGSEDERADVIDHVMACPACRPEFESLRAIARAAEQLAAADAPSSARPGAPGRARSVPRSWLAAAAAVVVMVGAGVVWQRQASAPSGAVGGGAEPMRGGSSEEVSAVAPAGEVAGAPGALTWRPVPGAARYDAELLDAAGIARYAASTSDTSLVLPDSVRLTTGAEYQWWVRAQLPDGSERRSPMRSFRVR